MMKKWLSKAFLALAACSMMLGAAACDSTPEPGSPGASSGSGDTYTYNDYMGASPINWSNHQWEMSNEGTLIAFITSSFMDTTIADDGVNWMWIKEMCTRFEDITSTYADKAEWGVPESATSGYVFQVDLHPGAKWDDGTVINADSHIYSAQQYFSSVMKNRRAAETLAGDFKPVGAVGYFNNDKVGQTQYGDAVDADGGDFYLNTDEVCYFFGDSMTAVYEGGDADGFMDGSKDLYAKYAGKGYIKVTDEIKADLTKIAAKFGDGNPEAWIEFCFAPVGTFKETTWDEVGILKTGEYQLTIVCEFPMNMFNAQNYIGGDWLVHEGLYEAGKKTIGGVTTTDYCTSLATTASYGPYKLVSFERDKQFVLAKNEYWYGWTDGNHVGQYQTDFIKYHIVGDQNTRLQLFLQGNLDWFDLTANEMSTYRMSDYLLKTDQTYTFRFVFASDLSTLKALEAEAGDGSNKQVLSYRDFRKALSYAIDRARFCAEGTAAFKPAYFLLNGLYYYNIEEDPNSIYRNTTEAKEAVLRLYGMTYGAGTQYATVDDAYKAVTGYDVETARSLFEAVYKQAIADGRYTAGQAVKINCMASAASALTADDTRQQDLLNEFVAEATKGTGFEGKITFTFKTGAPNRYDDVAGGRIEMIRGAWGGAFAWPFRTIALYCDPDHVGGLAKIHESNGYNPTTMTLDITYDFNGDGADETLTKTMQDWSRAINAGGEYANNLTTCMAILSQLESAVLGTYQCIPFGSQTVCSLYSQKATWATLNYNIMYAYGGIRLLTYNYTDAEWAEYVASQGGSLNYE